MTKNPPLVGRCFHIFGEDGNVQFQGTVRESLGDGNYLVQYFEWFVGEASTMAVVNISRMLEPADRRGSGAWQFYEDADHMKHWMECFRRRPNA